MRLSPGSGPAKPGTEREINTWFWISWVLVPWMVPDGGCLAATGNGIDCPLICLTMTVTARYENDSDSQPAHTSTSSTAPATAEELLPSFLLFRLITDHCYSPPTPLALVGSDVGSAHHQSH